MVKASEYTLVDTTDSLSSVIPTFCGLPTSPPSLYVDLEGEELGKNGTIALIQIYVLPLKHTYLIDVQVLGDAAFTTASKTPVSTPSLKAILESPHIPKCLFDVRHDSNALFFLYGVSMQGVQDIQLMELARRSGVYVNGLARCVEMDAGLSKSAAEAFQKKKQEGASLFVPSKGGSWEAFRERPMKTQLLDYCVQDVQYLPVLWQRYKVVDDYWRSRIESATLERVKLSKDPGFNLSGPGMARGPWGGPGKEYFESEPDDFEDSYSGHEDDYDDFGNDDFDDPGCYDFDDY